MQLLAVSSSSPFKGAAIMGVFALGTAPGLLGVGGFAAVLKKGRATDFFFKFIALLIIAMALYNISNGLNLVGYRGHQPSRVQVVPATQVATVPSSGQGGMSIDNAQIFQATFSTDDISKTIQPNQFTVKVGKPVKIEIAAKSDGLGCMGTVMIPGIVNTPKYFQKGQTTTLEFTPTQTGTFNMTCAMGVQSGQVIVTN
jgi:heme/copper-type cytochrome/quinol oxidase subunit 2